MKGCKMEGCNKNMVAGGPGSGRHAELHQELQRRGFQQTNPEGFNPEKDTGKWLKQGNFSDGVKRMPYVHMADTKPDGSWSHSTVNNESGSKFRVYHQKAGSGGEKLGHSIDDGLTKAHKDFLKAK
jgi:hypothetical protein